jgi:hypothetical protein
MTAKAKSACSLGAGAVLMVFPYRLLQWLPWIKACGPCLYLMCLGMTYGFCFFIVGALSLGHGPWREVKEPAPSSPSDFTFPPDECYPADGRCQAEGCINVATRGTPLESGEWEWVCRAHYRRPGRPAILRLYEEKRTSNG